MQLRKSTLVFLCVATLLVAAAPAAVATSPPAPRWANQFAFVSSVQDGNGNVYGSSQFYYDWSIPAVAQVLASPIGQQYTILNVGNQTWRVNVGNSTCCLCTNPYSCGDSTPPLPNWLQLGNSTKFLGATTINGRSCNGWAKYTDVAVFGWWTAVSGGEPCQLSWLLGETRNMVMSYYSDQPTDMPAGVFDIPAYCPRAPTPASPSCSISGF